MSMLFPVRMQCGTSCLYSTTLSLFRYHSTLYSIYLMSMSVCCNACVMSNGSNTTEWNIVEWRSTMVYLRTYAYVFCMMVLSGLRPIAYFVCYSFTSGSFVCSFRYTSLTLYSSLSLCVCVCVYNDKLTSE